MILWPLLMFGLSMVEPLSKSYRKFQTVVVDVENLRGKSGFALSHDDILQSMSKWSESLRGRVILAVDHGDETSKFLLDDYAILFSGNQRKADDTIASEVLPFLRSNRKVSGKIGIVTGDRALTHRCLRFRNVEILSPEGLLRDLESILQRSVVDNNSTTPADDFTALSSGNITDQELIIGAELLEIEANLRNRRGFKSRQRKQLRIRSQGLWRELKQNYPRMLDRIDDITKNGSHCESLQTLSTFEQRQLLMKWELANQFASRRRETTQDRVVLAERMRQKLLEDHDPECVVASLAESNEHYFDLKDTKLVQETEVPDDNDGKELTIVILSDTHGMESQLEMPLPPGDVLLHLGDFTEDDNTKLSFDRFDAWLGQQPHKTKIVVRGNHDPRRGYLRNARFITQPEHATIGGYKFAFVPFMHGGLRKKALLPHRYQILATHSPPHKRLDRCETGKFAGCKTLAKTVSKNPPLVWFCGHIHEGRGVLNDGKTTLINAANANPGKAASIDFGPTVVKMGRGGAEILEMDGRYTFMNQENAAFFRTPVQTGCSPLLLAVDLGLRTGVSLFDKNGALLRYEFMHYETTDDLHVGALKILKEWQHEYSETGAYLTHLTIEGTDPPLLEAWRGAVSKLRHPPSILYVRPEEWRADMLSEKEQQSGSLAKEASERLAQDVLLEYGHGRGSVATDVAESILLGVHVSRRLGWVPELQKV